MQNTTTCIFLLVSVWCVTLANAESVNLLLESRNKNLTEQLSAMSSRHQTMTQQLSAVTSQLQAAQNKCKSQQNTITEKLDLQEIEKRSMQLELDMRKYLMNESLESGKLIEKLARENENLKFKTHECQTHQQAVLKELRSLTSAVETTNCKSDITTEVGRLIYNITLQPDNTVTDIVAQILSEQDQLSDDVIQAVTKLVNEEKTWQAQSKDMFTQVLAKLDKHDQELQTQEPIMCEKIDLPTITLNGKRYYSSYNETRMSWYEARDFCVRHGMQLISVESQEEWNLIKPEVEKLLSKFGNGPWCSGSDAAEEGKWKWTATGSDVIIDANRHMIMHNIASKNCMYLRPEYWGDASCTDEYTFMCEVNTPC